MPCERKHVGAIRKAWVMYKHDHHNPVPWKWERILDNSIDAALAACDESPWRSMESAPKDGASRFLAVVNGRVRVVAWAKTSHVPMWGWCLVDQGPEDCDLCDPTHWMPLPAAPESTAPTGGAESKEGAK